MLKIRAQPLRRQLVVAIFWLFALMIAAAVALGFEEFYQTVQELTDQTQAAAIRKASAIERELTGVDRIARSLSTNAALQDLDASGVEPLLRPKWHQQTSLVDLVLVDRGARVVARGNPSPEMPSDLTWLAASVLETESRVISTMRTTGSGLHYVTVGYPVRDAGGEVVAVLVCYLNQQLLQGVLGLQMLPEGSVVTISQSDGRVLARSLDSEPYVGEVLEASFSRSDARAPEPRDSVDGVRRMYGEAIAPSGPWLVTVGIPMSVAFDGAFSLWARSFTILAVGLAGWLLVALVFSRRLTKSVGHLEAAAERVALGNFAPMEAKPMATREFAQLQSAFDHMLHRFNETRAALDAQMAEERRVLEEVRSLQRQVIRQERLAAVGQLVSGVAHEINNPLQAIRGFAELLQMQANIPDEARCDLVLIQKECARACGIIKNLALFTRQQTGETKRVRLTDVISSVLALRLRPLVTEDGEVRVDDTSVRHVLAVPAELQQVVLNFVANAEQAIVMSGRSPGRVTIRTRDEDDRVILEVEDTGQGVLREDEARLFQPFFTTKPVSEGNGLGLSVSYGIIDSLRGRIGYRSAPTGGAIFYFDLPAASE